ncbi:hypothetical protein PAP_00905 [Palaeococcus pacificus DY20341]|uniref:Uncharacterized protein n=1 Tax=Palaeococcus pacificus DY20341 TaxID=1343739 RepID=A0A075LQR1_9EURY|nr:hypothetical protein PAP_00905 [Palaeococcus pacificus DY20341]
MVVIVVVGVEVVEVVISVVLVDVWEVGVVDSSVEVGVVSWVWLTHPAERRINPIKRSARIFLIWFT